MTWGVIYRNKSAAGGHDTVQFRELGSRLGAPQDGQPAGSGTPISPRARHLPRLVPRPLFVCRWLRLRRQLLRLWLSRLYIGGGAETAWPPSGLLYSSPPPAARTL